MKKFKMKSNSSPNDIPSKFLKIAICIVSEWLSQFHNKCMTTGEFPDSWKIAHITPIPKVHSLSSSSEYRPNSVLPVLSKLFEKLLYHRVYSYLTEPNLIDKRRYGFIENHSTELVITTIYDELLRNVDNKLITCSLFLDLSKHLPAVTMKFYLINFITMVSKVFLINYSQIFCTIECSVLKYLNLHTKGYLAGPSGLCYFPFAFPYLH